MKSIEVNVVITGIRAKVDQSLGLTLVTPELTPEEKAEFMRLQGANLKALFTPLDFDAPKYKVDKELDSKSPSTRLRNVLYVCWQQGGEVGEFNEYYLREMERFISSKKDTLE